MELCVFFIQGLRVARFLNLRAVSGSKSDTPTRAKTGEGMIRKGPRKSKKSVSRRERRDAERKDRNIGMMEKEEYRRQENGKGRKIGRTRSQRSEDRGQRTDDR
jgi:hypothetical protein